MLFPKDFPDKLRSSILVSEVVGKRVKLKPRGREFYGLCPFHNEKTPSFTVNDQKGFYHCFGCSANGDAISFLIQNEGLEFRDAVVQLANDFGIPIPKVKPEEFRNSMPADGIERDRLILEKICEFFEKNLYDEIGIEARNYLKKRRLSRVIAKKFRLGFARNSYESLLNFLKSENFTEAEIAKTGAINRKDSNKIYDKFRNRIIFPITDKKNRIIAFGGRVLGDGLPKYLNSSETEFFKKSQTLYNLFQARKPIFDKGYAVIVEGYMDVISLVSNGIENVVAGLGTAVGDEHLKELFYITDKIVICLDGDEAGIRAAKRVSEISLSLITSKKNISFAFLPNKMDPDDFIKEFGKDELDKKLSQAIPLSEGLFEFSMLDLGIDRGVKISAENKAKLEASLSAKINAIQDQSSKKYFSLFFKDSLFFLGRNDKKSKGKNEFELVQRIHSKPSSRPADSIARSILAYIIKFPGLINFHDEDCDVKGLQFTNENLTNAKDLLVELLENESDLLSDEILTYLEGQGFYEDVVEIRKIISDFKNSNLDIDSATFRIRILLLRNVLLQADLQYRDLLKESEIETHQTEIINPKITEIFNYKNSLEQKIILLEGDL